MTRAASSHRAASLAFAAAAAGLLAGARPALAGIVVYENGNVLQGGIDPAEVTDDAVTVHEPRIAPGGPRTPGRIVVPRSDVRWFDAKSDVLEPRYFEKYGDKALDPKWSRVLVIPVEPQGPIGPVDVRALLDKNKTTRVTRSWLEGDLSLRAPSSATWSKKDAVARFELGDGASIHVYSAPAAGKAPSTQLEWIEDTLGRLAGEGNFEREDAPKLVSVPGGHDARVFTHTRRGPRTLRAVRQVCFREKRTYFVTCFAPEAAFESRKGQFLEILDSVRVDEGDAVDLAQVDAGHVWRWRSAARADAFVWNVLGKTENAVRYAETVDGDARPGEKSAPARLDARVALLATTGLRATPRRAGAETLTVSGLQIPCEIHEAVVEGKTYRLWLSRTFPATVKVTCDNAVMRELVEIQR